MRLRRFQVCGLALVVLLAAGALLAPVASAKRRAPARVKTLGCADGDEKVTFEGRMRAVRGARRMAMRFSLYERQDDGSFERLQPPGLGKLRRSRRGVRKFVFGQRVEGLKPGHHYRAVVRFTWYDGSGHKIRRVRRRSRVCHELGLLPNLRVVRIRQGRTAPSRTARYGVRVENTGGVAAEDVPVLFAVDGAILDTRRIARLEPRRSSVVWFMGPPCGRRVAAEVDPLDAIREVTGRDNRLFRACSL